MSRDIRSFFTVKSSTAGQKKSSSSQETIKKSSQKKRAAILIDSDSDEDSNLSTSKRSKTSLPVVKDKNSSSIKEVEDSKITSKYFETNKVNASDVFGSRPIKRDNSRNIIKKIVTKEVKEFHFDNEFESELAQLSEVDIDALTNGINEDKSDPVNKETKSYHNDFDQKIENNNTKHKIERSKLKSGVEDDDGEIEIPKKKIKKEISLKPKDGQNSIDFKATEPDRGKKHSPLKKCSPEKLPQKESPVKQSTLTSFISESPNKPSVKSSPPSKISNSYISTHNFKDVDKHTHKNESSKDRCDKGKKELIKKESPLKEIKKTVPHKTKSPPEIKAKPAPPQTISSPEIKEKFAPPQTKLSPDTKTKPKLPETESSPEKDSLASSLWVEKYKPTSTKQIIGQQGEKSCVNKLMAWLKNWEKNQSGNKKLAKPSPWAKNDDGAYFKAALLSGPPGVGKTTTAHLVSKELGFDVVEFNASDTRSKKLLHQEVSELLSTKSLSPYFTGKGEQVTQHHVLLMDEVDGMAGNEDRGGVQELILLIKQSRVPIICMCNDRNHPKIRSLANYCFDLRFSKPRAEQIRGAMLSMCFKEKMKINPNDLLSIISSANQDIRLIINHLSMLSMEKTDLANSTKHVKMGPWDFTRKIFSEDEHKSMSIHDKCDLFFHDYSLTPLFVQENYLNAVPHKPEAKNKIKKMELFAAAARSLSLGDLTEKRIRSNNAWNLLPVQAVFSSLVPGEILEGHIGAQIAFPAWFGKNSRQTKMNRFLQELTVHSRLKISGNKEAMNLDYLVPLESSIVGPLVRDGSEGVPRALATLAEYCLVREDLESLSELSSWPGTRNQFSDVDSKVKAAFTRAYNKTAAPTPYAAVPIKKGSKPEVDSEDTFAEENGSQEPEDEEEDSLEVDSMIVVKKKKVVKEARPSTSKGNKNSKRGRKN